MTDGFVYDGNLLCLDLVNTVLVRDGARTDLLVDDHAVLRWVAGAGEPVAGGGAGRAGPPSGLLAQAVELREAVRGLADRLMERRTPRPAHVEVVNAALARAPFVERVERVERVGARVDGFTRRQSPVGQDAAALLARVARSAAHLLTDLDATRLGTCGDPGCILYFYDTSKNRRRRWCSMERCGNRAKVSAHYRRRKA